MTGREKIEAAFSLGGSRQTAAVICYEGILIRDHAEQITRCPWWYQFETDLEHQLAWRRDVIAATGQDWFVLPWGHSAEERENVSLEVSSGVVTRVDRRTGRRERIDPPRVAGWAPERGVHSHHPQAPAQTPKEIDAVLPPPDESASLVPEGCGELAARLLAEFGGLFPINHVGAPLWRCYGLWGFEGMMTMAGEKPELVEHACRRFLDHGRRQVRASAELGAAGIWIEDCLCDMISPAAFDRLAAPFLRELTDEIRAAGMKSIYYFCGNPNDRWDQILGVGADALSLEESKKGFLIDIDEVVERADGQCVVLGNLDAMVLLESGTDKELRAEIARQIEAGRRNGDRFVMGLGSPVTPETTIGRVRRYCDLVHELGA